MIGQKSHLANIDVWIQWREERILEAKQALIESYLPLVDYVSNRLSIGLPKNVSKEDLSSLRCDGFDRCD
ncbi:hypothetical protein LJK87_15495 [Paenibacillus sp. P25]|nr:hypothetical protein LJK87_15495 [Paenibacillus sp. P25]